MALPRSRRARAQRRRTARIRSRVQDLTAEQWAVILELWGGCAYCGGSAPLQRDCVQPIAHAGRYTLDNVVPACRSCNAAKGEAEALAWMRRHGLDEPRFILRLIAVRAELSARFAETTPGSAE